MNLQDTSGTRAVVEDHKTTYKRWTKISLSSECSHKIAFVTMCTMHTNEKLFLCQQCNYKILQPQTTSLRQRRTQRQHSKKLHHVPTCAWKRGLLREKLTTQLLARSLFTTPITNTDSKEHKGTRISCMSQTQSHAHAAGLLWSACTSFPCVFRSCMRMCVCV